MQFSIKHLLVFILVWAITLALVPYKPWVQMRVTYYHSVATNDVREILLAAMSSNEEFPITIDMLRESASWPEISQSTDAWGHPLQIIESDRDSKYGYNCGIHAFSFGADGLSTTLGNDPDDINTWDDHHYAYYHGKIRHDEMMARLWQSLWLGPLLYCAILASIWIARKTTAVG